MFPRLFTVPAFDLFGRSFSNLTLHTYGALLAIAFLAGLWIAHREAKRTGMDAARITDMAVYVLIGGLVGARLLLLLVDWRTYFYNPRDILTLLQSGGVFYGGLLGALPVAWWYARRHKLDGWRTADVLAPGVVLGQSIGRLGCFAAGCCWGSACDLPWAVTFKDPYVARQVGTPIDLPLHPTQLYESLATALIFVLLLWIARRKKFHGQVALAYVSLYGAARFAIEFFRGDASRGVVFGGALSTSQFIAILMLVGAAVLFPYLARKQRLPPPA
ncbi:MAG: prolipoprotein diacylglyceryl transferase [Vicinamibacteria bacterium]